MQSIIQLSELDDNAHKVLDALSDGEWKNIKELAKATGLSRVTISRILGVLWAAGYVERRERGRSKIFRVVKEA